MKEKVKIRELIASLYPCYFLDKDIPKLETIYTAGYIDGLITASIIIEGFFDKEEAKDELIELLERTVEAKQLKNFIEQPPK